MRHLIQAKEYSVDMNARIQHMNMHDLLVNNFFKFFMLGILYIAIMHKCRFGQDYCIDLLKRSLKKFISHFMNFLCISTKFGSLYEFLEVFNRITDFKNWKCMNSVRLQTGPRLCSLAWPSGLVLTHDPSARCTSGSRSPRSQAARWRRRHGLTGGVHVTRSTPRASTWHAEHGGGD
jgi:hypothetical protein